MLSVCSRKKLRELLGRFVGAACGHWPCGRGHPAPRFVTPPTACDFGYTLQTEALFSRKTLADETARVFRPRASSQSEGKSQASSARRDIYPNEEWNRLALWRPYLLKFGLVSWDHSVRFSTSDIGSTKFLRRADILSIRYLCPSGPDSQRYLP